MRIISRLFRMFSGGRARRGYTHTHPRRGGMMTRTRGGGITSLVRRFLR